MAGFKNLTAAIRAPFVKRHGLANSNSNIDYAYDNNFELVGRNAADTADISLIKVGPDDRRYIGGSHFSPQWKPITFFASVAAKAVDTPFCIIPYAGGCKVEMITAVWGAAGGASFAANVKKVPDGVAMANGTDLLSTAFDLTTTADTVNTGTLSTTAGVTTLAYKDRLFVDFSGTAGSVANVLITVWVSGAAGNVASWYMAGNAGCTDQAFYVANASRNVSAVLYAHTTKGTHGSAMNVQVVNDTSTNAPGAGTDMLTNNTNAGFNCKGDNNVAQVGALVAAQQRLIPGNRLSVDFAGTIVGQALAGVCVTVLFDPTPGRIDVTYFEPANANLADTYFFQADSHGYELEWVSEVHSTKGSDGGAVDVQVTRDNAGTPAAGTGTDLLSNSTNAGFDLKGTENTVQLGTYKSTPENLLLAGDRLSLDYAGALTALVGVVVTATLKAA